jgi:8-oxo-dGTP diphosphatase
MPHTYEFPRPALTVDVVAVTSEAVPQVLLIRRKQEPCAGLWALPGGFVDENEQLESAARRELKEEAGLKVTALDQLITVGDPGRDSRGWTVSVVYLARLGNKPPAVQADDDADEVKWFPMNALPKLAFDHEAILDLAKKRIMSF